jgi:hypothetical protein
MKSFKLLRESLEQDIIDILSNSGVNTTEIEYENNTIIVEVDQFQLDTIVSLLPIEVEYEVYDYVEGEDLDDLEEIEYEDSESYKYTLIIYLDNMESDYVSEGSPVKTVRFVKGVKTIKMKCKSGEKYDGNTCVKMSSSEKAARRKAGKIAAKKRKGSKASAMKMRRISMKKRSSLGI